jgi:hypothetical protein
MTKPKSWQKKSAEDKEMKNQITAAVLLTSVGSIVVSLNSLAHDLANDCSDEIDAVRIALNDTVADPGLDGFCYDNLAGDHKNNFGEKICVGLNKKLDDTDVKIGQHKITDAVKKLTDFQNALDGLRFKAPGKEIITDAEYNKVNNPLAVARSCVDSLLLP